jgi:hypothetical protein
MTEPLPEWGGDEIDSISSKTFIKRFQRALALTKHTSNERIALLGNCMRADSTAEQWFEENIENKDLTIDDVITKFKSQFPSIEQAKKSKTDYERELEALRLDNDKLGEKETIAGIEAYTHVAFAAKALELAKRANIDEGTSYIWQVRDKLPDIIRDKVPAGHENWTSFTNAIRNVDITHIKDNVEKRKREAKATDEINARIRMLERAASLQNSPTAGIRAQLHSTSLQPPRNTFARGTYTPPDPFISRGGGRGNLFNRAPYQPRKPPTEEQKTTMTNTLASTTQHENTQQGREAYRNQLIEWAKLYGANTKVSERTPFPLKPGTAPAGSGECYGCGMVVDDREHTAASCTGVKVPVKEREWRAIVGNVMGNRGRTRQINLLSYDDEDLAWIDRIGIETDEEQEKEEGSPV